MSELHRSRRRPTGRRLAALGAVAAAALAGCGDDAGDRTGSRVAPVTTAASAAVDPDAAPRVVAATSWIAAFARAAGATDVTIVAPAHVQHPPDYDPRPSDLLAVADAEYVLLGGFEGFADRLVEATGTDARVLTVTAQNTPDNVRREVRALAAEFGTESAAEAWLAGFDARLAELRAELDAARPDPAPTAVAHAFMAPWAAFAGVDLVGTYGPAPVTATQLAELSGAGPTLLFANAHVPAGATFADLGALQIDVVNFPGESLDLLDVFERNTAAILAAFDAL